MIYTVRTVLYIFILLIYVVDGGRSKTERENEKAMDGLRGEDMKEQGGRKDPHRRPHLGWEKSH